MLSVCGEVVSLTENENLGVEGAGDIEGIQLGIDYGALTALNACAIKKLIERIEELSRLL